MSAYVFIEPGFQRFVLPVQPLVFVSMISQKRLEVSAQSPECIICGIPIPYDLDKKPQDCKYTYHQRHKFFT